MNHIKVSVLFQSPSTTSTCFIQGVYPPHMADCLNHVGDNRQEARAPTTTTTLAEKKTHKSLQGEGDFLYELLKAVKVNGNGVQMWLPSCLVA